MLYEKNISSPLGKLRLVVSDYGLRYLGFDNDSGRHPALEGEIEHCADHKILHRAEEQLAEYFTGKRREFNLPLELKGTVFQIKSWRELQRIPYGQTISYGKQAAALGDSRKARAVGMANNRNPLAIIIPCHRVIGSGGLLTGYSGGLNRKEYLLNLEQNVLHQGSGIKDQGSGIRDQRSSNIERLYHHA